MTARRNVLFTRQGLARAGALILAALLLAAGLELLIQRTLPPIYPDQEMDLSSDPTLIERGTILTDASGRRVLKEEWDPVRFIATFFLQLGILVLLFPCGLGRRFLRWIRRTGENLRKSWTENPKHNLLLLLRGVLAGVAVFFLCRVWVLDLYHRQNWMVDWLCALAGAAAAALLMFPQTLGRKPENLFLVLVLLYGGLLSFVLPDTTGVSMDDGFHAQHALNYSTLGHVRFTPAEWAVMQPDQSCDYELKEWDELHQAQEELYRRGAYFVTSRFHLSLKEYWMATHGLGFFLGRVLHLPFWVTWCLARFTGLPFYALLGYFAIRRLKNGKMVAALAWMIPTSVSLAVNFSYDAGVTAGIWLSFAYWLAQWQEPDCRLKNLDTAVILLGAFFACYAKQIYFPVYLLFLFLPRSKFRDRRHRRTYTLLVLLAMGLVMANILLPLGASGGEADNRSGTNANTFEQIAFILRNPLTYTRYLLRYLQNYLDLGRMSGVLLNYGYQGNSNNTELCMLILAIAAFTDFRGEGLHPVWTLRLAGQALLFGTVALMCTAMYAWFSAVGEEYFGGMQPRYLVPLVYPSLALLGSDRILNRISPAVYHGLLFAAMAFVGFNGVLVTCIEYYH